MPGKPSAVMAEHHESFEETRDCSLGAARRVVDAQNCEEPILLRPHTGERNITGANAAVRKDIQTN